MAQVVELLGAPGTGKSTLVGALDGRTVGGRRLVDVRRLLRVPRRGLPAGARGRLLARDLTPAERRRAVAAHADEWTDLVARIVAARNGPAPDASAGPVRLLHRLYAPGWVVATLELRALAERAPDDVVVLIDEGLAQRATVVCGEDADESSLAAYLTLLPPTLVHLHLDPVASSDVAAAADLLAARVTGRGRTIDRHAGLDGSELTRSLAGDVRSAARIAAALRTVGANVADVAVTGPVDASVEHVLRQVERAGG